MPRKNCGRNIWPVSILLRRDLPQNRWIWTKDIRPLPVLSRPVSIRIGWINLCGWGSDKNILFIWRVGMIICCMGSIWVITMWPEWWRGRTGIPWAEGLHFHINTKIYCSGISLRSTIINRMIHLMVRSAIMLTWILITVCMTRMEKWKIPGRVWWPNIIIWKMAWSIPGLKTDTRRLPKIFMPNTRRCKICVWLPGSVWRKRTPVRKIIILPDIPILSAIQGIICISGVAIPPIPVKIITWVWIWGRLIRSQNWGIRFFWMPNTVWAGRNMTIIRLLCRDWPMIIWIIFRWG